MSAAADAENIWQRLRKRIGKAKKSYEVALRGTATIGRHHKLSTGRYTANRASSSNTAPQQYGRRQYRYYSTQSGREVLSENDQTDGEYDDEEACSCPNTPLKGFVCEAEFAFPSYRPYHHQQDIIGMKGRQTGQPIPPPKPARPQSSQLQQQPQQHVSKQQQQQYKPEYRSGDSRGTAKEGDRDFHAYHKKVSRGEIVPDPDMTDGYHEFIKGNNSHINEFSRKYIDFVTPKTFPVGPNSSVNGEKQQQICPHGVPIPSTQSEVHTNDSLIKGVDSKKSQSITDYNKKRDNQVQATPALSANTAKKRVETAPLPPLLKPSAPNKTTTESFKTSKGNEVTNSQAVKLVGNGETAALKQAVVNGAVSKKSTWDGDIKRTATTAETTPTTTATNDRKLVITTASKLKASENNTPATSSNAATTSVRPATIASSSSSSLPPSCSAAAAGPIGAAGGSICIVSEEAGKLDTACSGTSTSATSQPQLQQQQVRNKIPPKTKPKPKRGVSGLGVVDRDKRDTNTGRNSDKPNADKAENKNEMSLEIKSQQPSSNDEDPGYASVEEIPLDSPGKRKKLLNCIYGCL